MPAEGKMLPPGLWENGVSLYAVLTAKDRGNLLGFFFLCQTSGSFQSLALILHCCCPILSFPRFHFFKSWLELFGRWPI
jgi:hypothetical protein